MPTYDPAPASTHNPTADVVVPVSWLDLINANFEALGQAWTSYAPSWTASGTNPVINNGTLVGAYRKIGKTLDVRISMEAGSTTTFGTGTWQFGLPSGTTSASAQRQVVSLVCRDADAGQIVGGTAIIGTSAVSFPALAVGSLTAGVSSTVPFTWATSDYLVIEGTIEIA